MKYYTFRKNVPKPKATQHVCYQSGKGYYLADKKPSPPVKKRLPVPVKKPVPTKPTSKAPAKKIHLVDPRTALAHFLHWGIANAAAIHYAEVRPITRVRKGSLPSLPWTTDCSGSGTTACQFAGIPDPNGTDYNGSGYTGTIMKHCQRISSLGRLRVGDPVVFGCNSIPGGHHVGWILAINARTPEGIILFSHGSERGPMAISVAEEAKYQPDGLAGVRYYSLGV